MLEEVLDNEVELPVEEATAIDDFFKAYVGFYGFALLFAFILSLFNSPESAVVKMGFNGLTFLVFAFHIIYFVLLIIKKKGWGRIFKNFLNFFAISVIAIGYIFHFGRWPYSMEMLTTGLLAVPFFCFTQVVYELVVRKEKTKLLNLISFLGISLFSIGVLFFLQKWPYGMNLLLVGTILTFVMTIVHLNYSLKKEVKYQIHIRYLVQCLFALITGLLTVLV